MRNLLAVSLIGAVACSGGALKDQARAAMPSKDTVNMGSPKPASSSALRDGQDANSQDSTAGDHSPFFDLTASVSTTFNGASVSFLALLELVTQQEPTSCTQTSCTWGPGSSALDYNNYQMVVTRDSDGMSFDWTLSGQAKSKPGSNFVTIGSGKATPGAQAHHGSGFFLIDFDAAATLDGPHDATGQLDITSYNNVGPAQLAVTYMGAKDGNVPTQKDNIVYSYANDATGGGDLDFAVHNTTTGDNFSVHSRWKNDGEGRADMNGLGGGVSVSLSECWGVAPFAVVYFTSSITLNIPPFGGPASGNESSCAFSPAAPSTKTAP